MQDEMLAGKHTKTARKMPFSFGSPNIFAAPSLSYDAATTGLRAHIGLAGRCRRQRVISPMGETCRFEMPPPHGDARAYILTPIYR